MSKSKRLAILFSIAFIPLILFSQQLTYKVVCDKKDHKIKIVESTNHSPDLIPLKAGFPFAPVARKWADENYPSGTCDPEKVLQDIKQSQNPPQTSTTQQPPQQQNTGTVTQSTIPVKQKKKYKNTSISGLFLSHNVDKVLGVEDQNFGADIGLEQIFGQKDYYGGIGAHFNVYYLKHASDKFETYLFKFPVFGGYRFTHNNLQVAFDAGFFISTKLSFFDEEYERFLRDDQAKSTSFSFFPRVRVGSRGIQLEAGAQFGITDVVENRDKLNVYFVGLRFCF